MGKITLEDIEVKLNESNWSLISKEYKNLNTLMDFKCPQNHIVQSTWGHLRDKMVCPVCEENKKMLDLEVKPKSKGVYRVLALDQATHVTGYAIYDNDILVKTGIFEAKGSNEIARITSVRDWLLCMLKVWNPDILGLEGIQFQEEGANGHKMGVTVFETLAHLQGVLWITAYDVGVECEICPTNTWRHSCGVKGRTRADKKMSMKLLVKEKYGLEVSDDIADAIGIGYHLSKVKKIVIEVNDWS